MDVQDFYRNFRQDILAFGDAEDDFARSQFLEQTCRMLNEDALISSYSFADHRISAKGQAVDVWSFDEEFGRLTLILGDYRGSTEPESLTKTELDLLFKRLRNFVNRALNDDFLTELDPSDPVVNLVHLINSRKDAITKVSLVVVSNAILSTRVSELPTNKAGSFSTHYDVWDLERLFRREMSGLPREDTLIRFVDYNCPGIPCLPAFTGEDSVRSYLLVVPGQVLANIYRDYGERLLEQNVRTFLQYRGKINKGIRNTIVNEPGMFFSYNNGLAATAEEVETDETGRMIQQLKNFQIVNGGQTTATIYTANRLEKADLSRVYVQVKLSVIKPDGVDLIVPRISEYSNTQNRVNAADFFSNHPFHLRVEEFSRQIWAPARDGGVQQTHWFYERARGQYANRIARLTKGEANKFMLQNPRGQMFTKTDLAKYYLSFEEAPHEVSLGAQAAFSGGSKGFKGFVGRMSETWVNNKNQINEVWFKYAVAKAIFFKEVDRMVYDLQSYSGYKANIVTYAIAKFAQMVRNASLYVDFLDVWNRQALQESVRRQMVVIAEAVQAVLLHPPSDATSNVSEWAKKPRCWELVKELDLKLADDVICLLVDRQENEQRLHEGSVDQRIHNSINVQAYVVNQGASYWAKLREWNLANQTLSPKEIGILEVACAIPNQLPTDKQCTALVAGEKRCIENGFFGGKM